MPRTSWTIRYEDAIPGTRKKRRAPEASAPGRDSVTTDRIYCTVNGSEVSAGLGAASDAVGALGSVLKVVPGA
jgi:hypothetical protein